MRVRRIPIFLIAVLLPSAFILSAFKAPVQASSKDNLLRLITVGDIYLGGASQGYVLKDPAYVFADVQPILSSADIAVGNLESPLSLKGAVWLKKTWILHSDPRSVEALKAGNFSAVTMANNHMVDYGPAALEETLRILDQNGIVHTGAGMNLNESRRPAILSKKGVRIAILAYNNTYPLEFRATSNRPGTAYGDPAWICEDIRKAHELADIIIVTFHWSEELRTSPKDYQRYFAHLCIDNGAQIVLGHHPHVLQGLEIYKNSLIAYSLGNFAFGTLSTKVRDSVILQIELDKTGLYKAILYPVNVNNHEVACQPKLRYGSDAVRVLTDLQHYSSPWGTKIQIQSDGTGTIDINS
ncbi:MAG TPA: CapA family protein [Bacillota bacterium]|nr:CapA family protein [Bacillota bacterium]